MFKRRIKPRISQRLQNLFWPQIGWRRSVTYFVHRVGRLPGTPYSIAAGIACGVAVSCTPLVGFHVLIGAFIAWLIGANVLASIIGTAAGNPWTFPFIWVWIYKLGIYLGAQEIATIDGKIDFPQLFAKSMVALLRFDATYLYDYTLPLLWPMAVGSLPTAICVWVGVYFAIKPIVIAYQSKRESRRARFGKDS